MERLCNLMFELSNEDRLRILVMLRGDAMRLSHVSERLGLSVQETSRHLSRLSDEKLVLKGVDGAYGLTPYGEHALRLLPGYDFLSRHREYLSTHSTSRLPDEFANRIGDLVDCTFTGDIMVAFHNVENMIKEAREYVWILSDQILMSTQPLLDEAVRRGVEFRLVLPEDMTPPPGFRPMPAIDDVIKRRTLERVEVILGLSEKVARVAFPTLDERMDHIGFRSTDEKAHRWCRDLFLYYWDRAKVGKPEGYPTPP